METVKNELLFELDGGGGCEPVLQAAALRDPFSDPQNHSGGPPQMSVVSVLYSYPFVPA